MEDVLDFCDDCGAALFAGVLMYALIFASGFLATWCLLRGRAMKSRGLGLAAMGLYLLCAIFVYLSRLVL